MLTKTVTIERDIGYRMLMSVIALLLAAAATGSPPPPAVPSAAEFRAVSSATARASVGGRIVSGARFGSGYLEIAPGAIPRDSYTRDAQGIVSTLKLMDFQ